MCDHFGYTHFMLYGEKIINKSVFTYTENSNFKNINPNGALTFEEAIMEYLIINFSRFDSIKRAHALCFLERYCMEYKKVIKLARRKTP